MKKIFLAGLFYFGLCNNLYSQNCVSNVSPAHGDSVTTPTPTLTWNSSSCNCNPSCMPPTCSPSGNLITMTVLIAADSSINNVIHTWSTTNQGINFYTVPQNVLQNNSVYWWRVRKVISWNCIGTHCNSGGSCGYNSIPFRFRTAFGTTGIVKLNGEIPSEYKLFSNYPNPFNPNTKIKFQIPTVAQTFLSVYDLLGREVATLVNEQLSPGTYEVDWDGSNYSSGIYYYTLQTEGYTETRKMVLLK